LGVEAVRSDRDPFDEVVLPRLGFGRVEPFGKADAMLRRAGHLRTAGQPLNTARAAAQMATRRSVPLPGSVA
jgi:hypothetical protein